MDAKWVKQADKQNLVFKVHHRAKLAKVLSSKIWLGLLNIYNLEAQQAYIIWSMPITSVRRSWPMQILKGSLYVMKELLKMTDVS